MKFKLKDFLELDTKSLFAVNGGSDCGGSSSPSGGSKKSSGASHSKGSGTYSVSGIGMLNNNSHASSSSSTSGGSCSSSDIKSSYVREFDNAIVTEYKDKSRKYEYEDGRVVYYPAVDPKRNPDTSTSTTTKGGYCSGASDGKTKSPNPYLPKKEPEDDAKDDDNGSGSSTTDTMPPAQETDGGNDVGNEEKKEKLHLISGNFGQITDGSYADNLTMQCYKNEPYKYQPGIDEKMNDTKDSDGKVIDENTFSKDGCKMAGAAKIASEITGENVSLLDVNNKFDSNKDGLLTQKEIETGLESLLGEEYDVKSDFWKVQLSPEKLNEISSADDANTTYVLGKADFGDLNNDGKTDYHWIVLEGWSMNSNGQIQFNYDGTSDNDVGRTYILGESDFNNKVYGIKEIQTFTLTKK